MRVFVTGGAGFIGRAVARRLAARGDRVTAVVRDQDPCPPVYASPDPLAEEGRGLLLLRALADDTSVSVTPAGKDVWVFIGTPDTPEHF